MGKISKVKGLFLSFFVLSLLVFINQSNAIELTFNFRINSSGPIIYACNAGLKHPTPTTAQVCYLSGSALGPTQSCVQGTHNCVCTGTSGGAYLKDYFRYKTALFDSTSLSAFNTKSANQTSFNQIFNSNTFGQRIDELTFNFGSERYGSEFFVDICYHGPQIEYYEDSVATTFRLNGNLTETDLSSSYSYRALAGLKARAVVACDTQGHGTLTYARNASGLYDTYDTEVNIENLAASGNGYSFSFAETLVNASLLDVFSNKIITNNSPNTPRFCVVRYYFRETNENWVRRWQRHDAQVVLSTSIEEP